MAVKRRGQAPFTKCFDNLVLRIPPEQGKVPVIVPIFQLRRLSPSSPYILGIWSSSLN